MNEHQIHPELKRLLEGLQEVPKRPTEDIRAGRELFLAEASSLKPPRKKSRSRSGSRRKSWVPRLAGVLAVVLLLAFTSLGGTVYAAQASQPDDLLYPLKTLTEDIQFGLVDDPEDRLDLAAEFANRRLAEIEGQLAAGEPVSQKALARLEKHNRQMFQEAGRMGEGGLETALRQIQSNLQKQNQIMAKLQKGHPQGGAPGLMQAQERIQERMRLVENGIQEPQGFQNKTQQDKNDPPGQENKPEGNNSNKPETPPGLENKDGSKKGNGKGQGKK